MIAPQPVAHLLVVDDDPGIRVLLANSLGAQGFRVTTAASAAEMDLALARHPADLVILDCMMPGEDGLSACRRLAEANGPPVILLSALDGTERRITGMERGADRYLEKPVSSEELLANIRAVLRREQQAAELSRCVLTFEGWRIDLTGNELLDSEGVVVHLSNGEFAVLRAFVERPRRVLTREDLLRAARGPDSDAFDRAIDVQVSRLRRKLRDEDGTLIRTVRNEGYIFAPPVGRA